MIKRKNGTLHWLELNVTQSPWVVEQCPECSNEVWLKWDVERDGYTIYCPYCGYRMKLCSMCDVRDGGVCDWSSETGECKNDKR